MRFIVCSTLLAIASTVAGAQAPAARVLEWTDKEPVAHPRVFLTAPRWADFRAKLGQRPSWDKFLRFPPSGHPDTYALLYLGTALESAALELLSQDGPADRLESAVTDKADRASLAQTVSDLAAADLLLAFDKLPPADRTRILKAVATIAYELSDPKGKRPSADAGMPETAADLWRGAALAMAAELVAGHPSSGDWHAAAAAVFAGKPLPRLGEPATVFQDVPVAELAPRLAFEAVRTNRDVKAEPDAVLRDLVHSLQMRCPPFDSVRGTRTLFGSPLHGPRGTSIFAWAAGVYRSSATVFAATSQWWHEQLGDAFESEPAAAGAAPWEPALLTAMISDPGLRARVPTLKSATVASFGAVVRDDAPSPAELYIALAEPVDGRLRMSYFHQAFPVCWAEFQPTGAIPAVPPAAPPTHEASVMRFAEYLGMTNGPYKQQVLAIKSPVASAPQYSLIRWVFPKTAGRLTVALPGSEFKIDDGRFLGMYPKFAWGVAARVMTPEAVLKPEPVKALDRGIPWHRATVDADTGEVLLIAFPYDSSLTAPEMKSIADGAGLELKARGNSQWVFLSGKPVKFQSESADFEGTIGAVREAPAVRSIQIFQGGKARSRDWTVETDGNITVLQRGPTTMLVESDGSQAQTVSITWKRVGRVTPEAVIDGKLMSVRHEEETTTFDVPAGKHQIRIDFDR